MPLRWHALRSRTPPAKRNSCDATTLAEQRLDVVVDTFIASNPTIPLPALIRALQKRCGSSGVVKPNLSKQNGSWTAEGWLASINLECAISGCLLGVDGDGAEDELAACRSLGLALDSEAALAARLRAAGLESKVARILYPELSALSGGGASAPGGADLQAKFAGAVELSYASITDFHKGLEGRIGAPHPSVAEAMRAEHTQAADSREPFTTPNYGVHTTSEEEWLFVLEAAEGLTRLGRDAYAEESESMLPDRERCRRPKPLAEVLVEMGAFNARLLALGEPELIRQEVIAARLYTGPLFVKYNGVLRGLNAESQYLRGEMIRLCCSGDVAARYKAGETSFEAALGTMNKYTTTIHAINSCIVKSAKLTAASKIYRGIAGMALPPVFWTANEFGVRGGVERAFLSTTTDRSVAMGYAAGEGANYGLVFEIQQGMVDRGADISWLSQYPHERETLFGPLTGLEVQGTRVDGSVVVIEARLSVNLNALTIEQVISKLQRSHVGLLEGMADELRFSGAPQAVLDPLDALKAKAQVRGREFFNDASLFKQATTEALETREAALDLLGKRSTWARVEGAPQAVAKAMRQCAELLAEKELHEAAALLLVLAVERCPVPREVAERVDEVCRQKLLVPSKLHRSGLEAFDHFLFTQLGGRNVNKQPWPLTVRMLVKHFTGDAKGDQIAKAICRRRDVDGGVAQVQPFERAASAAARKGSALLHAASMGDVQAIQEALAMSGEAAVNQTVAHGVTPLMLAARVGAADCVELLLAAKADATLKECRKGLGRSMSRHQSHGIDALALAAVCKGDEGVRCVDALLAANADPNSQSQPLIYAARLGHNTEVRSVLSLLRAGANVNAYDAHGKTALMYCALNSHGGLTKALLEDAEPTITGAPLSPSKTSIDVHWRKPGQLGPDLELQDADGCTALMLGSSSINQVDLLLRAGADPNHAVTRSPNHAGMLGVGVGTRHSLMGYTPLISAAEAGHARSVAALLAAGAEVNAFAKVDVDATIGYTALMAGAGSGDVSVVQQLLAAGSAVDAVDSGGSTAMVRCVLAGHTRVVELLTAAGAKDWDLMRDGVPRRQWKFNLRGAAGGLGATLTALPESIGECLALERLTLDGCAKLLTLPRAIRCCLALRALSLKGCTALTSLPASLPKLESLDLTDCVSLEALPECLLRRAEGPVESLTLLGCSKVLVELEQDEAGGGVASTSVVAAGNKGAVRLMVESEGGVVEAVDAAPYLEKMSGWLVDNGQRSMLLEPSSMGEE